MRSEISFSMDFRWDYWLRGLTPTGSTFKQGSEEINFLDFSMGARKKREKRKENDQKRWGEFPMWAMALIRGYEGFNL